MFMRPSSQALRRTSSGHVPSRSYSQATGRISLTAKSCAISRSALCSSVSVKSTIGGVQLQFQIDWSINSATSIPSTASLGTPVRVTDQADTAQITRAIDPMRRPALTSASAYWRGNSSGRRGARVRRLRRRHMGPWWLMQEAFGIVIFAVVAISAVLAVVSLFFRGRAYDEIGRGGIGDDREIRPAPPEGGVVDAAERDAEIRQMLAARNALAQARGEAGIDVEDE